MPPRLGDPSLRAVRRALAMLVLVVFGLAVTIVDADLLRQLKPGWMSMSSAIGLMYCVSVVSFLFTWSYVAVAKASSSLTRWAIDGAWLAYFGFFARLTNTASDLGDNGRYAIPAIVIIGVVSCAPPLTARTVALGGHLGMAVVASVLAVSVTAVSVTIPALALTSASTPANYVVTPWGTALGAVIVTWPIVSERIWTLTLEEAPRLNRIAFAAFSSVLIGVVVVVFIVPTIEGGWAATSELPRPAFYYAVTTLAVAAYIGAALVAASTTGQTLRWAIPAYCLAGLVLGGAVSISWATHGATEHDAGQVAWVCASHVVTAAALGGATAAKLALLRRPSVRTWVRAQVGLSATDAGPPETE